jgi:hypothetical protein
MASHKQAAEKRAASAMTAEQLIAAFILDAPVPVRYLVPFYGSRATFHVWKGKGLDVKHVIGMGPTVIPSEFKIFLLKMRDTYAPRQMQPPANSSKQPEPATKSQLSKPISRLENLRQAQKNPQSKILRALLMADRDGLGLVKPVSPKPETVAPPVARPPVAPPAPPEAQVVFPKEKRTAAIALADAMIADGINTPEAMVRYMDEEGGPAARKYADALWNMFRSSESGLPQVTDWNAVYDAVDKNRAETGRFGRRSEG